MTPPVTYLGKHENVDFRVSQRHRKKLEISCFQLLLKHWETDNQTTAIHIAL